MTSAQRQLLEWASEGFFPGEPLGDFSNNFLGESKVVKIVFYHQSKLRKQHFFANFFKILSPFRRPCLEGRAEEPSAKYTNVPVVKRPTGSKRLFFWRGEGC